MAWSARRATRYRERRRCPYRTRIDLGPGYVTAEEARAEFNREHGLTPPKLEAQPTQKAPYWVKE